MEMKNIKKGMVILAKPDRGEININCYVEWFLRIVRSKVKLTVVLSPQPPKYDRCMVLPEKNEYRDDPFELLEAELDRVVSGAYRRF